MELGVLITKKMNKEKTTGYVIAYIEPNGLVHRYKSIFLSLLIFFKFSVVEFTLQILVSIGRRVRIGHKAGLEPLAGAKKRLG